MPFACLEQFGQVQEVAVGKRMGINKRKTGKREILYVNTHCPPAERERNMLGCLLPFQRHIEIKVHKLFKKTTPAKLKGRRRRRGEKKKTSIGGRVENILIEKCQQTLLEATTSSSDCVCTKQTLLPDVED